MSDNGASIQGSESASEPVSLVGLLAEYSAEVERLRGEMQQRAARMQGMVQQHNAQMQELQTVYQRALGAQEALAHLLETQTKASWRRQSKEDIKMTLAFDQGANSARVIAFQAGSVPLTIKQAGGSYSAGPANEHPLTGVLSIEVDDQEVWAYFIRNSNSAVMPGPLELQPGQVAYITLDYLNPPPGATTVWSTLSVCFESADPGVDVQPSLALAKAYAAKHPAKKSKKG